MKIVKIKNTDKDVTLKYRNGKLVKKTVEAYFELTLSFDKVKINFYAESDGKNFDMDGKTMRDDDKLAKIGLFYNSRKMREIEKTVKAKLMPYLK